MRPDFIEDGIHILVIALIDPPRIAVDKGKLAVGVGVPDVVPVGDDPLNDVEPLGLAIRQIGIHVAGGGVIKNAPGRVRLPEEGPAVGPHEVTAVVRDPDGRQRFGGEPARRSQNQHRE